MRHQAPVEPSELSLELYRRLSPGALSPYDIAMTRSVFLLVAGLMAIFFGAMMLAQPQQMLTNMARDGGEARFVLQWMGVVLLSVGVINVLARNDPGSVSLRAIMLGNILLHVFGFGIDVYHHLLGFVQASGVVTGGVVHTALTVGFVYFLRRLPKH